MERLASVELFVLVSAFLCFWLFIRFWTAVLHCCSSYCESHTLICTCQVCFTITTHVLFQFTCVFSFSPVHHWHSRDMVNSSISHSRFKSSSSVTTTGDFSAFIEFERFQAMASPSQLESKHHCQSPGPIIDPTS